ncbi:MAG: hypothetical protein H7331_06655 [Bacteroidia bacterium]|nr:hypothetical protein [Bacteroidia bacterium]
MESDDEIIKSLIARGLIGVPLGALISKNKNKDASLGELVGAAIVETFTANQKAMQTNVPLYVEENGKLYLIDANRVKTYVSTIENQPSNYRKNLN